MSEVAQGMIYKFQLSAYGVIIVPPSVITYAPKISSLITAYLTTPVVATLSSHFARLFSGVQTALHCPAK
jgi:hypothetical protein